MAPVKFEENIKEKLEQRAITPSHGSWDKLAENLDTHKEEKSTKGYWWFGVAASIVAIIIVSNSFLNTVIVVDDNTPIQVVIDQDSENVIDRESFENESIPTEDTFVVETENTATSEAENSIKTAATPTQRIAETKRKVIITNQDAKTKKIASNTGLEKQNEFDNTIITNSKKSYAIVETQPTVNDSENLDYEIESLLSKAKKEVSTKTAINKEKSKVNAKGLLDEVEFDLDESFRDKVFQKLKVSYKKVSTAVAQRND